MKAKKIRIFFAVAAMTAAMTFSAVGCGTNTKTESSEEQTTEEAGETEEVQEENNLEENNHGSIERLVTQYCEAIASGNIYTLENLVDVLTDKDREDIQSRAAFIESIDDIESYTMNGPIEDSYIVFVCYNMKLINIDTPAPDIICLYVGPKEGDDRKIHYGEIDESMQEYVAQLEEDPDVKALYDDVKTRYQEAMEQDEMLAQFVQRISGQVDEEEETEETQEASAEEEASEESSEEENAEEVAEEEVPEEETSEGQTQNRQTRTTESVNVRAEASTESERVALAYQGDPITQIESYDNGWSLVEYKGLTGYVKTEFLE